MTSITQNSNMTKVDTFFQAFMVKAKSQITDKAYDALILLWDDQENQELLDKTFPAGKKSTRVSSVRKNSSGKKVKDPNKPKRGSSAYIFFCKDMRTKVKESMTDSTPRTVTSELGVRWNKAKAAGKIGKWEKLAVEDKERYTSEMADYTPPSDDEWAELVTKTEKKTKKKKTKQTGPKRACSSYIFFCKEMRDTIKKEQPDIESKDIMSELGTRWNLAKTAGKIDKWVAMAAEDKQRYKDEVSSGSEGEVDDGEDEIVLETKPKAKAKPKARKKTKSAKKKPKAKVVVEEEVVVEEVAVEEDEIVEEVAKKTSTKKKRVFAMKYWKEQMGDDIAASCGLKGADLIKEFSKRWKEMSKAEKAEWKEAAASE